MPNKNLDLPESILESPNFLILICNYFTEIENFDITKVNNIFFDDNHKLNFTLLLILDQHIDYIQDNDCCAFLVKYNNNNPTEYEAYVNIAQFSLNPKSNRQTMEHCDKILPCGPNKEVLPYARQTFIIPIKEFQTLGPGVYGIIICDKVENDNFSKIYSEQKFTIIPTTMGRVKDTF